jgi:hypothetical protein
MCPATDVRPQRTVKRINLRSIKESIDYSPSVGRMLAGCWPESFGSLAEYERELINERAADARAAAKARGKQTGRPSLLNDDQARQLRALHANGETVAEPAGPSRSVGQPCTGCSNMARCQHHLMPGHRRPPRRISDRRQLLAR